MLKTPRSPRSIATAAMTAVMALGALPAMAASQLMLNPTRVVLEDKTNTAQIELVNSGDEAATYRLSLVEKRMNDEGGFTTVTTPIDGERFASRMLRYSPRQITLSPGKSQVVRVMVRRPADLAAGEYRSHLVFERLPDANLVTANDNGQATEVSINLVPLIGASIPVIVRQGATQATAGISGATFHQGPDSQYVAFTLNRQGNRSTYGDLIAYAAVGGEQKEIGRANGVAVYTPNTRRLVKLAIKPNGVAKGAPVRLIYQERSTDGGKVLAETTVAFSG